MKRIYRFSVFTILCILSLTACYEDYDGVRVENWGSVENKDVMLYRLKNSNGMWVDITNYGGIITSVVVPDKNGKLADVVLGFDNLKQYTEPNPCFGAIIGRVANRIKGARFSIDGIEYQLTANDSLNCLHGGREFDGVVWDAKIIKTEQGWSGLKLHYFSEDGTNGFPGNVDSWVTYSLSDDNAIHVTFEAETDMPTHIDMTQHSYFNLTGITDNILGHIVKIDADNYLGIDEEVVPNGEIISVLGTKRDLTKAIPLSENMHKLNLNGYHFHYVFNKLPGQMAKVVEILEPVSGRTLDVYTTQPGIQFYTGNAISDDLYGKKVQYGPHSGFCLETHHHPNAPNIPEFPSTLLRPGEKYKETVIYDFGVKSD